MTKDEMIGWFKSACLVDDPHRNAVAHETPPGSDMRPSFGKPYRSHTMAPRATVVTLGERLRGHVCSSCTRAPSPHVHRANDLGELFTASSTRRNPVMKAWLLVSLLFTASILSTTPVSPQMTPRGIELSVDQAQAQATYGRDRRATRRGYRAAGYTVAPGYGATAAGYDHGGAVYGYGGAGYRVEPAGYGRWCNVYPSGFRWCWTDYASGYSGLTPQSLRRRRAGLNPQPLPP
jgi:hypothetical protein